MLNRGLSALEEEIIWNMVCNRCKKIGIFWNWDDFFIFVMVREEENIINTAVLNSA